MAALMMVNSGGCGQWVAPFGGAAGRLATNPLSLAVPTESGDPLLLDIATSVAPEGKIRTKLGAGQPIPLNWAVDHRGEPTTNPADLYGPPRGALLPFGGHKGFGLSMLVNALAGGLSGAGCCTDADRPLAGQTDGVLIVAINVSAFCRPAEFLNMIQRQIAHVKSAPPSAGTAEILVPGELEGAPAGSGCGTGFPSKTAPGSSSNKRRAASTSRCRRIDGPAADRARVCHWQGLWPASADAAWSPTEDTGGSAPGGPVPPRLPRNIRKRTPPRLVASPIISECCWPSMFPEE